ncbi:hypothetical protein KIN20_026322 [Parelaphostrongylus tenuis]|uniref:Uncharacterized protein n=1 Tax=Parelaphostrongylus tenuis TaxID=148309 RepID=A0AAD5NDQ0_PARTN|nr:hypothetical protein KIN20_026322 [Parelaphostrongylus tenuis]
MINPLRLRDLLVSILGIATVIYTLIHDNDLSGQYSCTKVKAEIERGPHWSSDEHLSARNGGADCRSYDRSKALVVCGTHCEQKSGGKNCRFRNRAQSKPQARLSATAMSGIQIGDPSVFVTSRSISTKATSFMEPQGS